MTKTRYFFVLGVALLAVIVYVLTVNLVLVLISAPNSWSVAMGMVGGVVLLVLTVAFVPLICKKLWQEWPYRQRQEASTPPPAPPTRPRSSSSRMVIFALVALAGLSACTRVSPGYVGIKVNYYGTQRGVEDFPLITGMVPYNPFTTSVFEYPTFTQTAAWTKDPHEGSPKNEEISYNSSEGMVFTADISLSYTLIAEKVPHFYVKFRSDDLTVFTHGFLRNVARDAFNEASTGYTAEQLYGDKKETVLKESRERLNAVVGAFGVRIEQFGYIGAPRPPEAVAGAINNKVKAIQDSQRTENEVRQAKAEAQKSIAKAEGEARANQILTASLSPMLIEWRRLNLTQDAIQKWDGRRPMVEGSGAGLLLNITPGQAH